MIIKLSCWKCDSEERKIPLQDTASFARGNMWLREVLKRLSPKRFVFPVVRKAHGNNVYIGKINEQVSNFIPECVVRVNDVKPVSNHAENVVYLIVGCCRIIYKRVGSPTWNKWADT